MTEYKFIEEDDEPTIEIEKTAQWQIDDIVQFYVEEYVKDTGKQPYVINKDTQLKTIHCTQCGKNFSRWHDFTRHFAAKHFAPTREKDPDIIRAAGGQA